MTQPKQITEIAKSIGIKQDELEVFGAYKAKVSLDILERLSYKPNGRLINVTCITPTKFGEGKTSTAIGLTQAFAKLKKKVILCLREPSLGPTFGIKGGGCGSGKAQIIPMEDINLHFTRDIYAVASAHNLLASILDNHIYYGNALDIDVKNILWRRVVDINDRALRHVTVGYKGKAGSIKYESGFDITAASEIMAILALTTSIKDLKRRLSNIIVAYTRKGKPVTAKDLKVVGSMAALLKDAIKPNIVQTTEGQPAFVHTGPFANIAHGNNSFISLIMASKLADYVITENGFGSELGAEKFFNIVCRLRMPGSADVLKPSLSIIVVSARAIESHSNMDNLRHHIGIIQRFGMQPIVAINKFPQDTKKQIDAIDGYCHSLGVDCVVSEAVAKGGSGAVDLAQSCLKAIRDDSSNLQYLYELDEPIKTKIHKIATLVYGASGVTYTKRASDEIAKFTSLGFGRLEVNIAKTNLSLSDDPLKKGVPGGWKLKIHDVRISAGAGFLVPIAGKIELMPGLPKEPAAERIDIDDKGNIVGLT
ncbi:MAG: formate--tetrahydrofolate ligase [Candidatus Omnitrophota bacterium]